MENISVAEVPLDVLLRSTMKVSFYHPALPYCSFLRSAAMSKIDYAHFGIADVALSLGKKRWGKCYLLQAIQEYQLRFSNK